MFERLAQQPPDPLLAVLSQFRADNRPAKLDLGVGVYRDGAGRTPVLTTVKEAETRLLAGQDTKAYVGPSGDLAFIDHVAGMAFGCSRPAYMAGLQTPGGTAALRLAADLLVRAGVERIWLGQPSWANHEPVFRAAHLGVSAYQFFDLATQRIDFDRMHAALSSAAAGDAVLVQACCHNPTGADLSLGQWDALAAVVARRGLVPVIDVAYQGLGRGIDEDMQGARRLLAAVPEALVAVSCSKNFGLYRERTGALFAIAPAQAACVVAESNLHAIARANYSMPPDHGAAIVRTILADPDLAAGWQAEVAEMRTRINDVRAGLAAHGRRGPCNLAPLADQRGMFSLLPLAPAQVRVLREAHAIYMPGSGRINVAGFAPHQIDRFLDALDSLAAAARDAQFCGA